MDGQGPPSIVLRGPTTPPGQFQGVPCSLAAGPWGLLRQKVHFLCYSTLGVQGRLYLSAPNCGQLPAPAPCLAHPVDCLTQV